MGVDGDKGGEVLVGLFGGEGSSKSKPIKEIMYKGRDDIKVAWCALALVFLQQSFFILLF